MIPDNWDEIITAASSTYGLIALGILVAGTLAVPMTKGATPAMRSGIFVLLVFAFFASLGVAVLQAPDKDHPPHVFEGPQTAFDTGRAPLDGTTKAALEAAGVKFIDANTFLLAREEQVYMQALGGGNAFHMEYRDGSADKHFGCSVGADDLVTAFTAYAANNDAWRSVCAWEKMAM